MVARRGVAHEPGLAPSLEHGVVVAAGGEDESLREEVREESGVSGDAAEVKDSEPIVVEESEVARVRIRMRGAHETRRPEAEARKLAAGSVSAVCGLIDEGGEGSAIDPLGDEQGLRGEVHLGNDDALGLPGLAEALLPRGLMGVVEFLGKACGVLVDERLDIEGGQQPADEWGHGAKLHHVGLHDLGRIGVLHLDRDRGAVGPRATVDLAQAGRRDRLGLDVDTLGELLQLLFEGLERLRLGILVEAREGGQLGCLIRGKRGREDGEGLAELQRRSACLGERRGEGLDRGRGRLGVDGVAIGAECRGRGGACDPGSRGDGDRGK